MLEVNLFSGSGIRAHKKPSEMVTLLVCRALSLIYFVSQLEELSRDRAN